MMPMPPGGPKPPMMPPQPGMPPMPGGPMGAPPAPPPAPWQAYQPQSGMQQQMIGQLLTGAQPEDILPPMATQPRPFAPPINGNVRAVRGDR